MRGGLRLARRPTTLKLTMSGDGRYFQDSNGKPFFVTGQCAWPLITQPSLADAQLLIDSRVAHGYNALLVALLDHCFADSAPNTRAGIAPFSSAGDFSTYNTTYFDYVKSIASYAESKGVVLFIAPLYLGYMGGNEGWEQAMSAEGATEVQNWGVTVGTQLKDVKNIVWVMGGDRNPGTTIKNMVSNFVTGLQSTGDTHLLTAHGDRNTTSRGVYPAVSWLNVNAVYTDASPVSVTATGYALSPFMPQFLIEDYYANEHSGTDLSVRKEGWWAVLSGCTLGQMTGENPTQGQGCAYFNSGFPDVPSRDWKVQLDSTSCNDRARIGHTLRSRRYWLMVPDAAHSVVTAGYSSGADLVTTSRASDGSSIVSYLPTGSTVTITVDMTKVSGSLARAWWYNPRTGAATVINTYATTGTQTFSPADTNDWVLVIDDVAAGYGAPGTYEAAA